MPLPHSQLWENLILDYFVVRAALPHQPKQETSVFPSPCMGQTGLPSTLFTRICCEKDVIAEPLSKAAGAEVDSRPCIVSAGICLVGAPLFKRLGVLLLTLRAARLPVRKACEPHLRVLGLGAVVSEVHLFSCQKVFLFSSSFRRGGSCCSVESTGCGGDHSPGMFGASGSSGYISSSSEEDLCHRCFFEEGCSDS